MSFSQQLAACFFAAIPAAALCYQPGTGSAPQPVEAPSPSDSGIETDRTPEREIEREVARREYLDARQRFAESLAAVLTSEEMADRAQAISMKIQIRRATDRLTEVQNRLAVVAGTPNPDPVEVRRLEEREVALTDEVERLRNPETPTSSDQARLAAQVVADRFRKSMAEESDYQADVLSTPELRQRTRRLGRLAALSGLIGGLRKGSPEANVEPRSEAPPSKPEIVPAGGTAEPSPDADSLGEGTFTPPSDAAPQHE